MHIAYIGQGLLVSAFAAATYSCLGRRQQPAVWGMCLALLGAFGVLIYAHVTSDFSLLSVMKYSHTAKPMLYKISGVWGNHEGSMLLWTLFLSIYTLGVIQSNALHRTTATTILSFLCLCFIVFLIATCDPFTPLASPAIEGLDLNPLLQDPALAIHPPFLYAGYVGFAVPFAWGLTTLLHKDERLFQPLYWSTLTAWIFLSIGLGLGAFWAYYELGWGGWWAWDPVENAALMPWLSALTLIHLLKVQQRTATLTRLCLALSLITFALCLLGTLITRSGLLTSVHTFALDPERGIILGGLCALMLVPALFIFFCFQRAFNVSSTPPTAPFDSFFKHSSAIIIGCVFFLSMLGTLAVGTLYPLFAEWAGYSLAVGGGFFSSTILPMLIPCLFVMGIALFLKPSSSAHLWHRALPRITLSLAFFLMYLWIWPTSSVIAWFFIASGIWVVISHLTAWSSAKKSMILAHTGLGLTVLGATHSLHHEIEFLGALSPGHQAHVAPYTLTLTEIREMNGPNYQAHQGIFSATIEPDTSQKWLTPEKRFYWTQNIIHGETAILSDALSHLYVTLGDAYEGDQWSVRAFYKPGINLLWAGWILIIMGAFWRRWGKSLRRPKVSIFLIFTLSSPPLLHSTTYALDAHEVMADEALDHRARLLYNSLRCPTCGGQSLADSPSETAEQMRSQIRIFLEQGLTDGEIVEMLCATYGEKIVSTPHVSWLTSLLWGAPWIFLTLSFCGLYWRHQRRYAVFKQEATKSQLTK